METEPRALQLHLSQKSVGFQGGLWLRPHVARPKDQGDQAFSALCRRLHMQSPLHDITVASFYSMVLGGRLDALFTVNDVKCLGAGMRMDTRVHAGRKIGNQEANGNRVASGRQHRPDNF